MEKHNLRYSDFRRIDLNLLIVFDALMEERHVGKAAARLFIGQPGMSNALKRLREAMGDDLFVRSGNIMEPTALALELAPSIRLWLESANNFLFSRREFDISQIKATVTISTIGGIESVLLPLLMARLVKDAPGIRIRTRMLQINEILAALDDEEIDIAVGPPQLPFKEWHLHEVAYKSYMQCVYCPKRLTLPEVITPQILADQSHVAFSWRDAGGSMVDRYFEEHGLHRNVVMTASCQLAILRLLHQFPLVSMQTPLVATLFCRIPDITIRRVAIENLHFDMSVIWHRRNDKQPVHLYLRKVVKEILQQEHVENEHGREEKGFFKVL